MVKYGDDSQFYICSCKLNVTIDRDTSTYIRTLDMIYAFAKHGSKRDELGDFLRKWNERPFILEYDEMDTLKRNNVINHMGQHEQPNLLNHVT